MPDYIPPEEVVSPKRQWSLISILYNPKKAAQCVLALGRWENKPVLALRWNGKAGNPIGSPQSRGLPTWFIVPDQFASALIGTLPPDMQTLARNFIPR